MSTHDPARFPHRVCIVTGAASGIGQALAVELAGRGCSLALCDVDEPGLEHTRTLAGTDAILLRRVDVSDREAVHGLVRETIDHFGQADAIFNNAGVTVQQTVADTSYEDFEWLMGINFWGVLHGTKALLPHLLERGTGAIVNISSVFGIIGFPTQSAYNASKFAVRGLTEALRHELRGTGITVSCVHPGGVRTNIVRSGRFHVDAGGSTSHEESTRGFEQVARLSPAKAAQIIVEGVRRRRARILVGKDAVVIDGMQRVLPVRYGGLVSRVIDRMKRERRS
ncbi:MAG: SDR family oxidoreductase [Myxococcales bacterium]|nr:SDR family oxidoreductase [Myxococcales bacterium]